MSKNNYSNSTQKSTTHHLHRKSHGSNERISQLATNLTPTSSIECESEYIFIDPRSHLEVSDTKHRYAKNLRTYFQEFIARSWKSGISSPQSTLNPNVSMGGQCGCTHCSLFAQFFHWLDDEEPKPEIASCPRSMLDTDVVQYLCLAEERARFEVRIDCHGKFWCHESLVHAQNRSRASSSSSSSALTPGIDTEGTAPGEGNIEHTRHCGIHHDVDEVVDGARPMCTGQEGWIFVVRDGQLLANRKETKIFPRFHHSTFFSGDAVNFAGMFVIESGRLLRLYPHSGHYRPTERHLRNMLLFLQVRNVDLAKIQVDGQRIFCIARAVNTVGEKLKKVEVAHMVPADEMLLYLT